jgi:hypothetical protein
MTCWISNREMLVELGENRLRFPAQAVKMDQTKE